MGLRVKSFLNQQIDLVSGDVGATPWNSAKANNAFVNCVGCTMLHGWCCKGNVRPMPGRVLRHNDGRSEENLPPT